MAQTLCTNCLAGTLEESGGVYVCSICGFQANVTVETTEFQPGVDDVGWRRRAGGSTSVRLPTLSLEQQEQQAAQQLTEAAFLYAQCIQLLLQAQGAALVSSFHCPPVAESVLRQLWLGLLPATQLLEPDFARDPSSHSRRRGAGTDSDADMAATDDTGGDTDLTDGEDGSTVSALRLVKPHVLKKALWKAFAPDATLQLCWLTCHILRLAVSPWDIADWAHTGLLPYLQWPELCRPMLQADGNWPPAALPVACLQLSRVGRPQKLLPQALRLVRQVDLPQPLPPVNGEAWLLRIGVELQLPQVVVALALDLYARHLLGTPALQLDQGQRVLAGSQPFVVPHTAILVALKLLYGLGQVLPQGNSAGPSMGVAAAPRLSLQQKLEQVERQHRALHEQLQQLRQGSPLPGAGPAELQGGIGGGPAGSAADAQPEAVDWVGWAAAAMQRILGASSTGVGPEEVLQWPAALRGAYLQFYHEVVCAGKTPPAGLQQVHDTVCGWAAGALPDGVPSDTTGRDGTADASAGVLPCPASAVGVQARAGKYQLNKMALPAAAPGYVAVLVLLAAHCHVAPKVLHEMTLRLEQQVQATEAVLRALNMLG